MDFNYTVTNGDSLSKIFLNQVKDQEGFDKSKVDWNKVMTVFDEIQNEKSGQGQKLFSGGTDKTRAGWGNSYVIHEGDKIELSETQLNRVYEAMGLDLSNVKTPAPKTEPITPTPQVEPETPTPKTDTPKADSNPPKAITPPAVDTNPPKAITPPAVDTNPPQKPNQLELNELLLQFNSQNKLNADKTIKNFDGTSYHYDLDGYISAVYDNDGNSTRFIYRYSDDDISYSDYEYDSDGNCTRSIDRYSDGSVNFYEDIEWDSQGLLIRNIERNANGSVKGDAMFEYDSQGKEIRYISRNADGSVNNYANFEYDSEGNQIRSIWRNPDGSVSSYEDMEYDSEGNLIRSIDRNPDGSVKRVIDY